MHTLTRKSATHLALCLCLGLTFMTATHATTTEQKGPTEEETKAKEEGRKTAAEAKAIVGLNKEVTESTEISVKTMAATRGVNEAVFKDKNPNETINMVTYQVIGGHIVEAKESEKKKQLRERYDAAYKAALEDRKALLEREFERDRAATEAEKLVNDRENQRELAAAADAFQRKGAKGAALDQIGETKKDYIRVQEQAQLAADRYAEAQAAYTAAQQKADASKENFDTIAKFYIQGNIEINKEELAEMKKLEEQVAAENAPAGQPQPAQAAPDQTNAAPEPAPQQ